MAREPVIGLFGYSYDGGAIALVLDSLARLIDDGVPVHLELLGAPGATSPAGEAWRREALRRGVLARLSFSGILPPQDLADRLASCEVLLFADPAGPSSRRTTLAASVASGTAVIAVDGPERWDALAHQEAVQLVGADPDALTNAIRRTVMDEPFRRVLGARGRAFAEAEMSIGRTATALGELIRDCAATQVK